MKIDRLIGILMVLVNKKKATARQLAEYFEVSLRTIQRDLDTLTMAGIPLYADVGVNGGYQLQDGYRLEKGYLNKDEAGILFTFLEGLAGVVPNREARSLYDKFAGIDFPEEDNRKLIVKLNPSYDTERFRDHLALLSEARDYQQKVRMTYYDVNFNITTRLISPYSLLLLSSTWYVFAYCNLRSDFRMFKLSRIAECENTGEPFELREFPEDLPWESHGEITPSCQDIVLEISKNLQGKLPDYFSPENCRVEDDRIIVRARFEIGEWLYSMLLGLVPHIKIIEPETLRKGFVERLQKSLDENS